MESARRPLYRIVSAGLALLAAAAVSAQFYVPAPTALPMSSFINSSYLANRALHGRSERTSAGRREHLQPSRDRAEPRPRRALVAPPGAPTMPDRLAATYPPARRDAARRLFATLLDRYPLLERQLGVPARDLAGSTATIIAASYGMIHDVSIPDEHLRPLIAQLRTALAESPALARASDRARRDYYEQTAILGGLLVAVRQGSRTEAASAALNNAKAAARTYLRQLLQVDPDRIRIGRDGLSLTS